MEENKPNDLGENSTSDEIKVNNNESSISDDETEAYQGNQDDKEKTQNISIENSRYTIGEKDYNGIFQKYLYHIIAGGLILLLLLIILPKVNSRNISSQQNISSGQSNDIDSNKPPTSEQSDLSNLIYKLHPGVDIIKQTKYSDITVLAYKDSKPLTSVSLSAMKQIPNDFKEIWNAQTSIETVEDLYFEDINRDGLQELIARGSAGAHSTYFYIYQISGDKFIEIFNQFGTDGVKLIDSDDNDGIKEIQVGQRNYDTAQTTTFRILKWNGNTYEEVKSNTDYTFGKDMTPTPSKNSLNNNKSVNDDLCLAGIYINSSEMDVEKILERGSQLGAPLKVSSGYEKNVKYKSNVEVKYIQKPGDVFRVISIVVQPIVKIRDMAIYESWDSTLTTGRGVHHGESFQNIINVYGNSYYTFKNEALGYKYYYGKKPVWLIFGAGQNGLNLNDRAVRIELFVEPGYY